MMKYQMIGFIVLMIILSGCATPTTPLPHLQTATQIPATRTPTLLPPTPTPTLPPVCQSLSEGNTPVDLTAKEIVSEMISRLNAGDVNGAMALLSTDARFYRIGVPPSGFETFHGTEAICRMLANLVSDGLEWELTILSAHNSENGVFITSKSKISTDYYNKISEEPNEFSNNIVVKDGQIVEFSSTLKEGSLKKLRGGLAEISPLEEPVPPSTSTSPGSEFSITFSDFTCTYEGPAVWKSGELNIHGVVKDQQSYSLFFVHVDESKDYFDLAIVSGGHAPYWARYTGFDFGAGENKTVQHSVDGQRMYLLCFVEKVTTTPIGIFGPYQIQP